MPPVQLIRPIRLAEHVPRPTTVMSASVEDVVTLGALREAVAGQGEFNKVRGGVARVW